MSHLLTKINNLSWAITESKLTEIIAFLENRYNFIDSKTDYDDYDNENQEKKKYKNIKGVAVIPVFGVIAKRMNAIHDCSGGTSTQILQSQIAAAIQDRTVKGIVLDIDSPGGTVDGTKEIADYIYTAKKKKPIYAFANGLMASAAYWIGSAADKIIALENAEVGSIGVLLNHFDLSEQYESMGIKKTTIYAGEYKNEGRQEDKLTKKGKEYLQEIVDAQYSFFLEAVARNRNLSISDALKVANGKLYIAKNVQNTLIDGFGTLENTINLLLNEGVKNMNIQQIHEDYPELYEEIFRLGVQSVSINLTSQLDKAKQEGIEAGIAQERGRVIEILNIEGHFEASVTAIKEGKTVEQTYKLLYEANKQVMDNFKKEIEGGFTAPVTVEKNNNTTGRHEFLRIVDTTAAEKKISFPQAMIVCTKEFPEQYQKYLESLRQ